MSLPRLGRAARLIVLAAALLGLPACMQKRIAGPSCGLRLLPVAIDAAAADDALGNVESARPQTYIEAVEAAARTRAPIESVGAPAQHLVLSGGGKWGSFGAGLLEALPGRPDYRVVTGVSTGALQASFALIANQPVPASRAAIYTADADLALAPGDPQPGRGRLFIDDLVRAYTVDRSETIIVVRGGELTALRRGAAADFAPLRRRLTTLIDRDMMQRIADATGRDGRGLFVGVVDMDDGKAYAIDLGNLANRAVAAGSDFAKLQGCYVDALIASSSEPLEVAPVFVARTGDGTPYDSRMYMDGGIRDGVFLEEVLTASGDPRIEAARPRIDTTVIVNGDLSVEDHTRGPPNDKWARSWGLLPLLLRTKELFVDQIYQFSVNRVRDFGSARGAVYLATARGYQDHLFAGRSCAAWKTAERAQAFPPTFMRCMIDYGRSRGTAAPAARWDFARAASGAGAPP